MTSISPAPFKRLDPLTAVGLAVCENAAWIAALGYAVRALF